MTKPKQAPPVAPGEPVLDQITGSTKGGCGTTEPSSFIEFVIGQLQIARINLSAEIVEIETTIAALRGGLISIEAAVAHLDALGLVPPSSIAEAA
jgi:hypothetical protein